MQTDMDRQISTAKGYISQLAQDLIHSGISSPAVLAALGSVTGNLAGLVLDPDRIEEALMAMATGPMLTDAKAGRDMRHELLKPYSN